ncbi:MAG: glycoside hydrolase family 76 protein [Capsulimonas sp.]|uniref:glycoside hydrolase family 76 protein n=1 Tax=Capsulimonas sp. TaxID=2494211 RepID=UPI003267CCE6
MTIPNAAAMIAAMSALSAVLTAAPAHADYRQKAEEQTDYIQTHFYDAKTYRYRSRVPVDPKELPYDFMWANGVQFTVLAAAAHENPKKYKTALYEFTHGLESYWDPKPKSGPSGYNAYCSGPGGTDKYYDDNEWLVLGLVEAYEATKNPNFLKKARATQKFVLSGWDSKLDGGVYWKLDRKSKNTCSNTPASAAALRLYQVGHDKAQLSWALKIRKWTKDKLQDSDGLYWDNIDLKGKVEKTKWTYNTGLAIRTDVLLYQMQGDKKALAEARRMADAGLAQWTDPKTGSLHKTEGSALFTHLFCESLLRLYDVTRDIKYLDAVRSEAAFAYEHVRDPDGGYWNEAKHKPNERKKLIENAAAARLFWLLTPYPETGTPAKAAKKTV